MAFVYVDKDRIVRIGSFLRLDKTYEIRMVSDSITRS